MSELTEQETEDAQKIINALMKYFWAKVDAKMADGKTFEQATTEVQEEFLNEKI